ncbi:hypothetical protein [Caudoviricetes sp.]|nr:hypothetical protein [Caudoviricetes sp.]
MAALGAFAECPAALASKSFCGKKRPQDRLGDDLGTKARARAGWPAKSRIDLLPA